MGIRLRPRDPTKHQVGNAILYGGATHTNTFGPDKEPVCDIEVFYVETDFGNHMKLTWREVEEMFTVIGWQDYGTWRQARAECQSQPPLNAPSMEDMLIELGQVAFVQHRNTGEQI